MNSALTYALYFLVQKELGQAAPMPTNQIYWHGVDDCSDAGLIADLTIWATTTPKAANQAFNSANGDYIQWRYMWPRIAEYLGGGRGMRRSDVRKCFDGKGREEKTREGSV